MKLTKNAQSSNKSFIQIDFNVDTIFIRSNERKWYDDETKEHIGWVYDEIQMSYNQFLERFNDRFDNFQEGVIANNDDTAMSIIESFENMFNIEEKATAINDDIATSIIEIMENQLRLEQQINTLLEVK